MKELCNLVVEQLLPGESGPGHAVVEVVRLLLNEKSEHGLQGVQGLSSRESQSFLFKLRLLYVLTGCKGSLSKLTLKHVPGPLQCVLDSIGEVFQGADWDRLLWWVLGGGIAFSYLKEK